MRPARSRRRGAGREVNGKGRTGQLAIKYVRDTCVEAEVVLRQDALAVAVSARRGTVHGDFHHPRASSVIPSWRGSATVTRPPLTSDKRTFSRLASSVVTACVRDKLPYRDGQMSLARVIAPSGNRRGLGRRPRRLGRRPRDGHPQAGVPVPPGTDLDAAWAGGRSCSTTPSRLGRSRRPGHTGPPAFVRRDDVAP
jgi:hypothetical protein